MLRQYTAICRTMGRSARKMDEIRGKKAELCANFGERAKKREYDRIDVSQMICVLLHASGT